MLVAPSRARMHEWWMKSVAKIFLQTLRVQLTTRKNLLQRVWGSKIWIASSNNNSTILKNLHWPILPQGNILLQEAKEKKSTMVKERAAMKNMKMEVELMPGLRLRLIWSKEISMKEFLVETEVLKILSRKAWTNLRKSSRDREIVLRISARLIKVLLSITHSIIPMMLSTSSSVKHLLCTLKPNSASKPIKLRTMLRTSKRLMKSWKRR